MSEIKWAFPNNGSGQERGVADAGIETFSGQLIASLTRETCQNSLDAVREDQTLVRIEIENHVLPVKYIPEYDRVKDVFQKMYEYWKLSSDKARDFIETALNTLNNSQINILRISDYNTTGLLKPYNPTQDSTWKNMTKIDGGGSKSSDKNGGFGIGKNAPYANSLLRMVFYRTYNKDNEKAAQGIARLLSYPEDINNIIATTTTGVGYYGNPMYNQPVESILELDNINKRDEVGTDLFIYGFNTAVSPNWEKDIIVEVLSNFLISIYNEKLEVTVSGIKINKENLHELIEEYIVPNKNKKVSYKTCYSNYLVLTSSETKQFEKEFHGLGTLKLSVLVNPDLDLDKRILRTRRSGMKLFARTGVSKAITFSGILELEGDSLKKYFKDLEPPTHDKWEADRNKQNPIEAQEYIDEISKWEQEIIWDLGEFSDIEEVNVEGLSDVLSSQDDKGKNADNYPEETLDYKLGDINVIERPKKSSAKGELFSKQGKDDPGQVETLKGRLDDEDGEFGAQRILKDKKHRKKRTKHKGVIDENGEENLKVPRKNGDKIPLKKIRVLKIGSSKYQLSFELPFSIGEGHLELCSVGENNKAIKLSLLSAKEVSNCKGLVLTSNNVNFTGIVGETKCVIQIELSDSSNFAMEVLVYEH